MIIIVPVIVALSW